MKKIINLLTIFILVFTMSVSAGELDFLQNYNSYEQSMSLSFELKKPLKFFEFLKAMSGGETEMFDMFDLQTFFESLADMNMTAEVKANISSDYKKADISIESKSNIPMQLNKNFKLTADTLTGMWVSMDLTDDKNPKYTYIMQNPTMNKYMVMDIATYLKQVDEESAEQGLNMLKMCLNKEFIDEITEMSKKSLINNAKIKKSGSVCEIILDDAGFKNYFFDVLNITVPMLKNILPEEDADAFETGLETVKTAVSAVKILGDAGCKYKYTLNGGVVKKVENTVEIDFDLQDILAPVMGIMPLDTDVTDINFVINTVSEYKNVNKSVKVEKPFITPENSVDLNERYETENVTPEYEKTSFFVTTDKYFRDEAGNISLPLRDVVAEFGIPGENLSYINGVITIKGTDTFKEAIIIENTDYLEIDGIKYELEADTFTDNGRAFVDTSLVLFLFNAEYGYGSLNMTTGEVFCSFYLNHYNYDRDNFDDMSYFTVTTDKYKKTEDGTYLVPVRDMLAAFYIHYDITVEGDIITVMPKYAFDKAVIIMGSDEVLIDGKAYKLKSSVIEENGTAYIDLYTFAKIAFKSEFDYGEEDISTGITSFGFYKNEAYDV